MLYQVDFIMANFATLTSASFNPFDLKDLVLKLIVID